MFLPGFPQNGTVQWQTFSPIPDTVTTRGWQVYQKPVGASWLFIIGCGPGGGGAGGGSTVSTARVGGFGGGAGALVKLMIPSFMVPDVLFVRPQGGGVGAAAASSAATNPGATLVAVAPDANNAAFFLMQCAPGGGGTTSATGAAGSFVATSFQGHGVVTTSAGQAGASGGANTGVFGTTQNITIPTATIVTGGAGGGGSSNTNVNAAGGNITGSNPTTGMALWPTITGGTAGVTAKAQNGLNHSVPLMQMLSRNMPLIFSGGAGGGANGGTGLTGGAGGDGAWGSGGGGGGAGATGGVGGNGGPGFVIIGAF